MPQSQLQCQYFPLYYAVKLLHTNLHNFFYPKDEIYYIKVTFLDYQRVLNNISHNNHIFILKKTKTKNNTKQQQKQQQM